MSYCFSTDMIWKNAFLLLTFIWWTLRYFNNPQMKQELHIIIRCILVYMSVVESDYSSRPNPSCLPYYSKFLLPSLKKNISQENISRISISLSSLPYAPLIPFPSASGLCLYGSPFSPLLRRPLPLWSPVLPLFIQYLPLWPPLLSLLPEVSFHMTPFTLPNFTFF